MCFNEKGVLSIGVLHVTLRRMGIVADVAGKMSELSETRQRGAI